MGVIRANSKIGYVIKQHPEALEAIISLSPKFEKLRNPVLQKLIASRTSIQMASKIGNCSVEAFLAKLESIGMQVEHGKMPAEKKDEHIPEFYRELHKYEIQALDVRPAIDEGDDPFQLIMSSIKALKKNQILKLINSFEPVPLIRLLGNKKFESYSEHINENLVYTYFYSNHPDETTADSGVEKAEDWDLQFNKFKDQLITTDVRNMEMPQPMITILKELDELPEAHALFVYHKKIPLFLLPELVALNMDYRIKEISGSEVHLLIFRK